MGKCNSWVNVVSSSLKISCCNLLPKGSILLLPFRSHKFANILLFALTPLWGKLGAIWAEACDNSYPSNIWAAHSMLIWGTKMMHILGRPEWEGVIFFFFFLCYSKSLQFKTHELFLVFSIWFFDHWYWKLWEVRL